MEILALVILFLGLLYFFIPKEEIANDRWNQSLPKNTNSKGLSRGVTIKNMDTKPYNPNCRISNYEPPKPVGRPNPKPISENTIPDFTFTSNPPKRPNTTSSIKNFKR